jgi:nicotinamide riboside kinase
LLELIVINESVKTKLIRDGKNILDIFMIWEINKDDFNKILARIFFSKKVKYAIISTEDFYDRLNYWDKLIKNILTESWNIFIKDNLKIKEKLGL